MKDTAPGDALGYVVVSLPERASWQGFFVLPAYRRVGEEMLRNAEAAVAQAPRPGDGAAETEQGLPGVPPGRQPVVGALSAALVHLYASGDGPAGPVAAAEARRLLDMVGGAAWALHRASGRRWLLVSGERDRHGRSGFHTTIRAFDDEAADFDEARERMAAAVGRARQGRELSAAFEDMIRRARKQRDRR